MALEAGTKVGRYTIARLIAQGGMAEVYRAEQELTSGITRPVAVKVIRPEYSESEDFRQMFLDEARTACTLSHPNIVHIYEVGEAEDHLLYMAMELVPGETLATIARTLRQANERFSNEALCAIGIYTCSALEAVHALRVEGGRVNLVHRDVSPHNLLLSAQGGLKLIDFGISKAATNRNLTMPGITKGKAGYFSPEQAMGKRLDGRSDVFSLGVTLYKLASGGTPFDDHPNHGERHAALVRGQWKRLAEVFPGLPEGIYEVVDKALMLAPDDRYQSARDMREALEKAAFDARLRVGQSSLLGYLTPEGQVTTDGGARAPASASAQDLPKLSLGEPAKPHARAPSSGLKPVVDTKPDSPTSKGGPPPKDVVHTEKVSARPPPSPLRYVLMGAAFVAAVLVGVVVMVAVVGGEPPPAPRPPVATPQPPLEPAKPSPPLDLRPADPELVALPPPEPAPVAQPAPVEPVAPAAKPTPEPKRPPRVAAAPEPTKPEPTKPPPAPEPAPPLVRSVPRPEPVAKVEVSQDIPAGTGKLRISATQPGVVAAVLVGGDDWGTPPVNKSVPSGQYTVTLKLTDGRKTAAWKGPLMPDQTRALMYDVETDKWR